MVPREVMEHWALERLSGGSGLYPLPENDSVATVFIGFPVEDPSHPVAIFKGEDGATVEVIEFRVTIVPEDERTYRTSSEADS